MVRTTDAELLQLVQEKGEEYWTSELMRARTAVFIYLAVFACSILIVLWSARLSPEFLEPQSIVARLLVLLPWVLVVFATLYVGYCQVALLPFMNSHLVLHWLIVSVFAVVACAGPLWIAMLAGSNSIAKRRLLTVLDLRRSGEE